jgi:chromosome segregation ATPase
MNPLVEAQINSIQGKLGGWNNARAAAINAAKAASDPTDDARAAVDTDPQLAAKCLAASNKADAAKLAARGARTAAGQAAAAKQAAEGVLNTAQKDIDDANLAAAPFEKRVQDLGQQKHQKTQEAESARKEIEAKRRELNPLNGPISSKTAAVARAKKETDKLDQEQKRLEDQAAKLEEQLKQAQAAVDALKSGLVGAQANYNKLKGEKELAERQLKDEEEKLAALPKRMEEQARRIEEAKRELADIKLKEMEAQINQQMAAAAPGTVICKGEEWRSSLALQKAKDATARALSALAAAEGDGRALEEEAKERGQNAGNLKGEIGKLQGGLGSALSAFLAANGRYTKEAAPHLDLEKKIPIEKDKIRARLDEIAAQRKKSDQATAAVKDELAKLESKAGTIKRAIDNLESAQKAAKQEADRLYDEQQKARTALEPYQKVVEEKEADKKKLEDAIKAAGAARKDAAEAAETAYKSAARGYEAADGGHSLDRHGPDLTTNALTDRLRTGFVGGAVGVASDASSKFHDHETWVETRDIAVQQIAQTNGLNLANAPGPGGGGPPGRTIQYSRNGAPKSIGRGFIGHAHRQRNDGTFPDGAWDETQGLTRTRTTIRWSAARNRWTMVQHFPLSRGFDVGQGAYGHHGGGGAFVAHAPDGNAAL